jgi:hypothetical protein
MKANPPPASAAHMHVNRALGQNQPQQHPIEMSNNSRKVHHSQRNLWSQPHFERWNRRVLWFLPPSPRCSSSKVRPAPSDGALSFHRRLFSVSKRLALLPTLTRFAPSCSLAAADAPPNRPTSTFEGPPAPSLECLSLSSPHPWPQSSPKFSGPAASIVLPFQCTRLRCKS